MPKCVVFGCKNTSEEGYILKRFPSDATRKSLWLRNILREDWKPGPDAMVCEVHFPPNMWVESKDDFLRVLNANAVPTVFEFHGDQVPSIPYCKARKCAAYQCLNRDGYLRVPSVTLHKFPLDLGNDALIKKWKLAVGDENYVPNDSSYLCSDHFKTSQFVIEGKKRVLLPCSAPQMYMIPKGARKVEIKPKPNPAPVETVDPDLNPYVEILGLEPTNHKDVNADIIKIALFFGVDLQPEDIERCFIFKKKNATTGEKTFNTIIVKFANIHKKKKFIQAYSNSDETLMDTTKGERIILTEQISPANKKLLLITEKIPINEIKTNTSYKSKENVIYKKIVKRIVPQPSTVNSDNSTKTNVSKKDQNEKKSAELISAEVTVNESEAKSSTNVDVKSSKKVAEKVHKEQVKPKPVAESSKDGLTSDQENVDKDLENIDSLELQAPVENNSDSFTPQQERDLVNQALESFGLSSNESAKNHEATDQTVDSSGDKELPTSAKPDDNSDEDTASCQEDMSINDEPDSSLDSGTYNRLKDSAAESKIEVKLERLDHKSCENPEVTSSLLKTSKPFKKRFSPDSSVDEVKLSPTPRKKRKVKKLKKVTSTTKSPIVVLTPRSKRRVVKPQKFEEFDCSYKRVRSGTPQQKPNAEVIDPKVTRSRKQHISKTPKPQSPVKGKKSQKSEVNKKSLKPSPKKVEEKISSEKPRRGKRKILLADEDMITEPLDDDPPAEPEISKLNEQLFDKFVPVAKARVEPKDNSVNDKGNQNAKQKSPLKSGGRLSNFSEPMTILHGVTPVNTSKKQNATSRKSSLIALTPLNIPDPSHAVPDSPSTNFKLITNFVQLIGHLKERSLLKSHVEDLLSRNFSHYELYKLMRCKEQTSIISKYSGLQTQFALILYLHAPDCYSYLSTVFSLPSESILENSMISSNFRPGFLKESFSFLKDLLKYSDSDSFSCYLIIDSVPLKKSLVWDEEQDDFVGYTQLFQYYHYENSKASQAVVVMLSFLNRNLNIPLGYFPLDVLYPDFLASIVNLSVNLMFKSAIHIMGIVLDSSDTSFSCSKFLGCTLTPNIVSFKLFTKHNVKIPILFDCHHLVREVRDCFNIVDVIGSKSGEVEWKYIQYLNERLSFKFSSDLLSTGSTIMNLKLDSNLAEAIEEQKVSGDCEFTCSDPTITFIKCMDRLLNTFSYDRLKFKEINHKEVGNKIQKWFSSELSPYLNSLAIDSESLVNHRKVNFVNCYILTVNSLCFIYQNINKHNLSKNKDFPKYKLTLDPLDMFYYRNFKVGNKFEIPDSLTFRIGLKRYMDSIGTSRLVPLEEIPYLLADFRSNKRSYRCEMKDSNDNKEIKLYVDYLTRSSLKSYNDSILILISDAIKNRVQKKLSCLKCISMISVPTETRDDHTYTFDWQRELALIYDTKSARASQEVVRVIKICHRTFEQEKLFFNIFTTSSEHIKQRIMLNTKMTLFENTSCMPFSQFCHPVFVDVHSTTHEIYLTSLIIEEYVQIRLSKIMSTLALLM